MTSIIMTVAVCLVFGFVLGIARERFRYSRSTHPWHEELRRLHEERHAIAMSSIRLVSYWIMLAWLLNTRKPVKT